MSGALVAFGLIVAPDRLASRPAAADVGESAVRQQPGLLAFSAGEIARIAALGPWPMATGTDAANRVAGNAAAIAFGARLFTDTRLSRDGTRACASCHRPDQAFQDGLPVAMGRTVGIRNTPGLLDVAAQRWFGWGGGNDSLWSASLEPLLSEQEMGHSTATLARLVRGMPDWVQRYEGAFAQSPPQDDAALSADIAKALAAYQATLVSPRNAFDDFRDALLRGERTAPPYPLAAQRGLRLFIGEGRCTTCHVGPTFSNGEFADAGVPFFVPGGVDAGRHEGLKRLLESPWNRLGRFNDAGANDARAVLTRHLFITHRHFGEFKVPGLRQLAQTAPYMHDGSLATIEDVVRHYSELDPDRLHADGQRILRPLRLSTGDAADLAAFLRSLSR